MTANQATSLFPLLIVSGTSVVVLLEIALWRSRALTAWTAHVGLAVAGLSAILVWRVIPQEPTPLLVIDGSAVFFQVLLIATTFVVGLLSVDYLRRQSVRAEEYYVLLLLGTLGAMVLAASRHFASLFLGLETLSVGLYGLFGYLRTDRRGNEAAMKYLILAGATSAVLLFGMALVYAKTSALDLAATAAAMTNYTGVPFVLAGATLFFAGLAFKLALVPFHWWTPDVYQGAPAPVTAYVATVSKAAVFALVLRFVSDMPSQVASFHAVLYVCAAASMLAGNILALMQDSVKRLLAYSSIAHLGYALVPLVAGGPIAAQAATFYIFAYVVTILIAFGVVSVLSRAEGEADMLGDYRGLFARNAPLAFVFTVSLLSLAGIPLTAGFMAKFQVASAGASGALWVLLVILAVSSVIGVFYYVRVIAAMLSSPEPASAPSTASSLSPAPHSIRVRAMPATLLTLLLILLFWLGIYPAPWLHLITLTPPGLR